MPGVGSAGTPSRSQIQTWDVDHLETAATHWSTTVEQWEGHFTTIHHGTLRPGGTTWNGAAADAAAESTWRDLVKVRGLADGLHSAAGFARHGAGDIAWAKRQAITSITEAEEAGFTVREDLSVKDKTAGSLLRDSASRQQQAQAFAAEISSRAKTLTAIDEAVASQITAALAPLETLNFPEDDKSGHPTVQPVDNKIKRDEPKPDPWAPHPDYPNRTNNGKYGAGNSRDGKEAEEAALAERERRTRIPIIRQQVRATSPDVINPDTKQPQQRYFDGLEPTGNPDEYIGIEAKPNPETRDRDQERFDRAISRDHPAAATLNGRPITIVGAQTVHPPDGWVPSTAATGTDPPTVATPTPGAASGAAPGLSPPPVMRHDDGAPLLPSGGSNPLPSWGTHISPDEAAKGGGEIGDLGKFYRGMFPHVDPTDPDNTA